MRTLIPTKKTKLKLNNEQEIWHNNNFNLLSQKNNDDIFIFFQIDKNIYNIDPFIIKSKIEEFKTNSENRIKNHYLYYKIINKENIDENEILARDEIIGDKNFFFHNLSLFFTNNQNYYHYFWQILYIYINKNKKEIFMKCPFHLYNDVLIDLYIYISHINEDKNYSGDLEFF